MCGEISHEDFKVQYFAVSDVSGRSKTTKMLSLRNKIGLMEASKKGKYILQRITRFMNTKWNIFSS